MTNNYEGKLNKRESYIQIHFNDFLNKNTFKANACLLAHVTIRTRIKKSLIKQDVSQNSSILLKIFLNAHSYNI